MTENEDNDLALSLLLGNSQENTSTLSQFYHFLTILYKQQLCPCKRTLVVKMLWTDGPWTIHGKLL